ncbi:hypothetical protein ACFCT7_14050 [Fulvivirgaceae bacterium LMO-SS25]
MSLSEPFIQHFSPDLYQSFTDRLELTLSDKMMVLLITGCASLYPSWLITKVKTVSVLKNFNPTSLSTRFSLQKVLIVFQFFIALVFIISTIIIGTQLRYTLKPTWDLIKTPLFL